MRHIVVLLSGVIIAGLASVHAQVATVAAAGSNTVKDQDIVVLSPFEVISEEETGYVPTTDVSGTRLNTPIRDIAAPISVLTTELLNDVGALNISDAYEFMPNVTTNDLNADALEIDYVRPRIRGLAANNAAMTNFFPEYSDMDRYKLERMGSARGPNALLAGIGDPAGMLTASTKTARFKNAYNIETVFTTAGGARGMIDANHVLLRDRLAVRAVGMQQYMTQAIEPVYKKDRRLFLTTTVKLLDRANFKTSVRGSYEWVRGFNVAGNGNLATENFSAWMAAGQPTRATNTGTLPGTSALAALLVDVPGMPIMNYQGALATNSTATPILEERIYPYTLNVKGPDSGGPTKVEQGNISLQQQIGRNLFIEAAYFSAEELNIWPVKITGAVISADPNQLLPNGQPNPNVGKLFVQHDGRTDTRIGTRDVARIQAAYQFDFARIGPRAGKWLGKHQLFGIHDRTEFWTATERLQTVNSTPLPGAPAALNAAANRVFHRSYLDFEAGQSTFRTYDYRQPMSRDGVTVEALPVLDQTTALNKNTSTNLALQSAFWDGRIVTTFGTRWDEARAYSGSPIRAANGLFPLARTVPVSLNQVDKFEPTSKGIVVHPLKWLSFAYNESENFEAGAAATINYQRQNLPTAAGTGKDYGVRLNFRDNRLNISLNKYESGRVNAQNTTGAATTSINRIWNRLGQPEMLVVDFPTTRDTFDNIAKGYELTMTYNPNRNWRFHVAAAKNKTVLTNVFPSFRAYIAEHRSTWVPNQALVTEAGTTIAREIETLDENVSIFESQEGVKEFNSREWTGSIVASYSFTETRLRGLRLSANVRYFGDATVGVPVRNGVSFPNEGFVEAGYSVAGLGASYSRKLSPKLEWYGAINVKNALDWEGRVVILARRPADGGPLKARWMEGTSAMFTTGLRF